MTSQNPQPYSPITGSALPWCPCCMFVLCHGFWSCASAASSVWCSLIFWPTQMASSPGVSGGSDLVFGVEFLEISRKWHVLCCNLVRHVQHPQLHSNICSSSSWGAEHGTFPWSVLVWVFQIVEELNSHILIHTYSCSLGVWLFPVSSFSSQILLFVLSPVV